MPKRYPRPPGQRITYTPLETAQYVSRKARVQRGLTLRPERRQAHPEGWHLFFRSRRGPALYGGCHRVTARRYQGDSSGGSGSSNNGLPPCPPPGTALFYTWSFVDLGYDIGLDLKNEPWALVPGTIPYWMAQATAFDPVLYPSLDFGGYEMVSFESDGVYYDHLIIDRAWPDSQGDQISLVSQFFLDSSTPNRPATSPAFDNNYPNAPWRLISVTGDDFTSTSDQGFENDTYCDPGGGQPPLPPGYIAGQGPWAYTCSCPDHSHSETPYQVPTYPSQRRSRSWPATRPPFPCKHMIAAALAIADQGSVQQWSQEAEGDLGEGAVRRE
jgi:hypothetical protein